MADDMEETHTFLTRFPPFDSLSTEELAEVGAASSERDFAAGQTILVEDGPPSRHFYVVRSGSVELLHEGELIDVLEPGEGFGHPSLLTGMAPAFTVRAHEPSRLVLVPKKQALAVLGGPRGAGFVAATLRERLTRAGHTVHALPELGTVHVADLLRGPPLECEGSTSIRHAAELMTEHGVTAALVRSGEPLLVTDGGIRAKAVAGPISADNPVIRIADAAVVVEPTRLAVDAVVEMLDAHVEHVLVADRSGALGILSASDLMGLERRSPFAVRHEILRAHDVEELVAAATRLPELFVALLDAGLAPPDVGRVLSLQFDSLTTRLIDFAIETHGPAPTPWAWLAFGSVARRELTLGSDQEHGVAYAEGGREIDSYFASIAADVVEGLVRCGFVEDANNVLASQRLWRMSAADWEQTFVDCFGKPDESHLIRATVAFDFRHVSGGLEIVAPLVARMREAGEHPDFIRRVARTATDFKPPLGFRKDLVTGRDGDAPEGTFDVKRGGMLPIVNIARFLSLSNQVTISSTLDRLVALEELGALEGESAIGLREAFTAAWRVRLAHHATCIEAGRSTDNFIDPKALPPLMRQDLREAFRAIAAAQKKLSVWVPSGI
jgi:CBS domain-containing protein